MVHQYSAAELTIRAGAWHDIAQVQRIYRHHVLHGLASFEIEPPSEAEMVQRWERIVAAGLPYLVAERAGEVFGYAYAGPYRPRPAYRHTVENSIYVRADHAHRGIGRGLLAALIAQCETAGLRQMIAVIGDSGNLSSIELHRRLGFTTIGTLRSVGYKFGRWVDSVLMQRPLGRGDAMPP